MRLLTWNLHGQFSLTEDLTDDVPPYIILSHTWGADRDEVDFTDIQKGLDQGSGKDGFKKLQFCRERAQRAGINYIWVDTCCINKVNNSELSEAITSMFRWYSNSVECCVYLSDVTGDISAAGGTAQIPSGSSFRASRWFTRGWTLQELLAPSTVEFFSREGHYLGSRDTLVETIHEITTIPLAALNGASLSTFSITERIRWSRKRNTKKREDKAYCLLGIFNVFMPLIYGEGENALRRLRKEIDDQFGTNAASSFNDSYHTRTAEELKCLRTLKTSTYEEFKDRNPTRVEGTCQWVLTHPQFQQWRNDEQGELLWISADPGCGKSVLAKSLVDHDLDDGGRSAICHFFFKDNEEQDNLGTALCAILHQIFTHHPDLIRHILPL